MKDKIKDLIITIILWAFIIIMLIAPFVVPVLIAESDLSPWIKFWLLK